MALLASLVAAVLVTWMTRISFITLLPTDRFPVAVKVAIEAAAPAVLGALTVVTLLAAQTRAATFAGQLLPLGVAALLAYYRANLAIVVMGAIAVAAGLQPLGW